MFAVTCIRRPALPEATFGRRKLLRMSSGALIAALVVIPFLTSGVEPSAGQTTTSSVPDTSSSSSSSTPTSAGTTSTSTSTTTTTTSPTVPATLSFEPARATAGSTVGVTAELSDPKLSVPCELLVGAETFADCAVAQGHLVGWFTTPGTDPTGSVVMVSACTVRSDVAGATSPCVAIATGSLSVVSATQSTTTTSSSTSTTSTTTTTIAPPPPSSSGVPPYLVVILVVLVGLLAASLSPPLARGIRARRRRRWFERHDSFRINSGEVGVGDARLNAPDRSGQRIAESSDDQHGGPPPS